MKLDLIDYGMILFSLIILSLTGYYLEEFSHTSILIGLVTIFILQNKQNYYLLKILKDKEGEKKNG